MIDEGTFRSETTDFVRACVCHKQHFLRHFNSMLCESQKVPSVTDAKHCERFVTLSRSVIHKTFLSSPQQRFCACQK